MNRIVREHYPVADLPEDLWEGFDFGSNVRVSIEQELPSPDHVLSIDELFALRDRRTRRPRRSSTRSGKCERSLMTDEAKPRIYVDSTIFIDAFEGPSEHSERLRGFFQKLTACPNKAVTNEFTLAELLGKVSDHGWVWQNRFYLDLIVFNNIFDLRPLSRSILIETGTFRKVAREMGRAGKLPDAIHAVTALASSCKYLLTCDKRFLVPLPIVSVAPDESGLNSLIAALDA